MKWPLNNPVFAFILFKNLNPMLPPFQFIIISRNANAIGSSLEHLNFLFFFQ
jgi:hypothetical protein